MNIDFQQIHTFNAGGDIRHQDHFTNRVGGEH